MRSAWFAAVPLLLALSFRTAAAASDDSLDSLLSTAHEMVARQSYDEALAIYDRVSRAQPPGDPARVRALIGTSDVRLRQGRYDQAVEVARQAVGETAPPETEIRGLARFTLCQGLRAAAMHRSGGAEREAGSHEAPPITRGEVTRPVKLYSPAPDYTEEARKAGAHGAVILQGIVDPDGCYNSIGLLKGLPHGLSQAAAMAVNTWAFEPATMFGKPVAVYYSVTVHFDLSPPDTKPKPGATDAPVPSKPPRL
jgi:TonB family protein